MNFYFYWYYIIHGFYFAYIRDFHFDILAIGLFSIIVSFLVFGLVSLTFIAFGIQELLFRNPIIIVSGAVGIQLINLLLFQPKRRTDMLMLKFRQNQSLTKDILAIILTIMSFVTCILVAILNNEK